jgi:hypothetical protein
MMEALVMAAALIGAMWAGTKRPVTSPTLFAVEVCPRTDLWE